VTHAAILATAFATTSAKLAEAATGPVLYIQDTTSFDFSHHPATKGLGMLENKHMQGFLAHTTLAVSMAPGREGLPLGLVAQAVWARPVTDTGEYEGTRAQRHTTAFAAKESFKWVEGLAAESLPAVDAATDATTHLPIAVCDREAHIYDFFCAALSHRMDFIVRASDGRSTVITEEDERLPLFAAVAGQPVQICATIDLKQRPDRAARTAVVEVRYTTLTLKRPQRSEAASTTLTVQVVDIFEPNPPEGSEAVHWLLVTSCPVTTPAQAEWIVQAYLYRWLIERFHYILKSGLKLEESQLHTFEALKRLTAIDSIVAWRLLEMLYHARCTPHVPCTAVVADDEWQVLYIMHHKTSKLPAAPPSLQQAVRWIAQMGGFLGRKGDGEPGVKVLWRGWTKLSIHIETSHAFRQIYPHIDVGNA
jgi:hypothetical protein